MKEGLVVRVWKSQSPGWSSEPAKQKAWCSVCGQYVAARRLAKHKAYEPGTKNKWAWCKGEQNA